VAAKRKTHKARCNRTKRAKSSKAKLPEANTAGEGPGGGEGPEVMEGPKAEERPEVKDGVDVEEGVEGPIAKERLDQRVIDLVVGEAFKAIYSEAAHGQDPKADRPPTIRSLRGNYQAFGFEKATDVDQMAEKVSFLFLKPYER